LAASHDASEGAGEAGGHIDSGPECVKGSEAGAGAFVRVVDRLDEEVDLRFDRKAMFVQDFGDLVGIHELDEAAGLGEFAGIEEFRAGDAVLVFEGTDTHNLSFGNRRHTGTAGVRSHFLGYL